MPSTPPRQNRALGSAGSAGSAGQPLGSARLKGVWVKMKPGIGPQVRVLVSICQGSILGLPHFLTLPLFFVGLVI